MNSRFEIHLLLNQVFVDQIGCMLLKAIKNVCKINEAPKHQMSIFIVGDSLLLSTDLLLVLSLDQLHQVVIANGIHHVFSIAMLPFPGFIIKA